MLFKDLLCDQQALHLAELVPSLLGSAAFSWTDVAISSKIYGILKVASCKKYCHSCASDIKEEDFIRDIWFNLEQRLNENKQEKKWIVSTFSTL